MKIVATPLPGLQILESIPFCDARGSFMCLFNQQAMADIIGDRKLMQISHSTNKLAGTVRGLHFQHPPESEMKMVRCIRGRVWDVAVDLRKDSPTFLRWHAEELSPENLRMMVIPEGFAHGFQALEPESELLYLSTANYNPSLEGGVHPADPMLNITWPLPVYNLSIKDQNHPLLKTFYTGVSL